MFTQFAPGGPEGFWFNGLLGRVFAKIQPLGHAGLYTVVAEMLDLQPEDELLDIGCGPGAFMADKAGHVRRVVGLDPSRIMLDAAEKRLAERIAAGTARLVQASAADLPFSDGEFSVITAITAPANLVEVSRVLRPGGRFVWVDELIDDSNQPSAERIGRFGFSETEFRRIIGDAGFIELVVRYEDVSFPAGNRIAGNRIVACRKPSSSLREVADGPAAAARSADVEEAASSEATTVG
jgi:SAM-dependent methyltransferase